MSRPITAFNDPQFKIIPDVAGPRDFGNVSNLLEVEGRESAEVPVVIPTSLFLMMKDILKIDPSAPAFLYLAQDGEYFILGIAWAIEDFCDLWTYTERTLPVWLHTAMA